MDIGSLHAPDIPISEGGPHHVTIKYGMDIPRQCTKKKLAQELSTSQGFSHTAILGT